MNALFPVETHASAVRALALQGLHACRAGVAGANEIDDGSERVRARVGDDGGTGVEEFSEGWGARDGKVKGEIFSGEDESGEVRGGRADGREGGYCYG